MSKDLPELKIGIIVKTMASDQDLPFEFQGRKAALTVRAATPNDIPDLMRINKAAYPIMAEENVVWKDEHLRSHLRVFPEGQLVAVLEGKVIGGASSLIVNLGSEPLRAHTWAGITDGGFFHNHDPGGDTLYGADVYVDPAYQGWGAGSALYEGRRRLCRKLNLRRILAGGRLAGYAAMAEKFAPEEYAERVVSGLIYDPVLSFQVREGFIYRSVLRHYIRDPKSNNCASLIEWINPDYEAPPEKVRKVRLACVQYHMRKVRSFEQFKQQVAYFVDVAADYRSDFVLFPELFTVQLLSQLDAISAVEGMRRLVQYTEPLIGTMSEMARRNGLTIIAGTHPVLEDNRLQSVAFICLPDGSIHTQPKLHVTPNERKWWGLTGGNTLRVIDTPKAKIGVLVCYDAEFPEAARFLADQGAEILFVPFCTDNRQGYLRVRYCCQARAIENQVYVAMTGTVGNLPDVSNMDIHFGQAAVFTPCDFAFARDGIQAEAESNEETLLVSDVDLDDLDRARQLGTVTPRLDRRTDLFRFVVNFPELKPAPEADKEPSPPLG